MDKKQVALVKVAVVEGSAETVTVKDVSVNYLGNITLYTGEMGYISTLINNGENNGGLPVKYSFDNKGIVKIDAYGHVTAKKAGKVKITAKCGDKSESIELTVEQPLKLYKVNKSYIQAAPKEGKDARKVTFAIKTTPALNKLSSVNGTKADVKWNVTTPDTGIRLLNDSNGKAVFEVPYGAKDTLVTANITDPVTGKTYRTDCVIDVK